MELSTFFSLAFSNISSDSKGHDFFRKRIAIPFFLIKSALQVSSAMRRSQEILREPLESQGQLCKVFRHVGSKSFVEYPFLSHFRLRLLLLLLILNTCWLDTSRGHLDMRVFFPISWPNSYPSLMRTGPQYLEEGTKT